jgi:hypothetical protein
MKKGPQPNTTRTTMRRFFWSFVFFYLVVFLVPHYCGMSERQFAAHETPETTYYELQSTWKWAIPIAVVGAIFFCLRMESKDRE